MGFLQTYNVIFLGDEHPFSSFLVLYRDSKPFGFDPYPCHGSAEEGQEQSEKERVTTSHNQHLRSVDFRAPSIFTREIFGGC